MNKINNLMILIISLCGIICTMFLVNNGRASLLEAGITLSLLMVSMSFSITHIEKAGFNFNIKKLSISKKTREIIAFAIGVFCIYVSFLLLSKYPILSLNIPIIGTLIVILIPSNTKEIARSLYNFFLFYTPIILIQIIFQSLPAVAQSSLVIGIIMGIVTLIVSFQKSEKETKYSLVLLRTAIFILIAGVCIVQFNWATDLIGSKAPIQTFPIITMFALMTFKIQSWYFGPLEKLSKKFSN